MTSDQRKMIVIRVRRMINQRNMVAKPASKVSVQTVVVAANANCVFSRVYFGGGFSVA